MGEAVTTRAHKAAEAIFVHVLDSVETLEGANAAELVEGIRALLVERFGAVACNADESEPIFVLAASDTAASAAVRMYRGFAERWGNAGRAREATEVEAAMLAWRLQHGLDQAGS